MKKFYWSFIALAIVAAAAWSSVFYLRHLRGVWPAIKKPSQDIAKLVDSATQPPLTGGGAAGESPLKLPSGFSTSIFSKELGRPRVMMWGPEGDLWVSVPASGRVVALPDRDGDGRADVAHTLIEGLNRPHGLAMRCVQTCEIFIAESHRVGAYTYDRNENRLAFKRTVVDLPDGGNHTTRTIMMFPDAAQNTLLVSIGSSCNVCLEKDRRRASIQRVNVETGEISSFAEGLRNAVFMAIEPVFGTIWVTEMGRDLLGDNLPPDEINVIDGGKHYGWPWCYGNRIHDASFDKKGARKEYCRATESSYIDLPAHSAPLGLAFIPEEGWPAEWWHHLLVAYHGSWNRSVPTGYKIVRIPLRINEEKKALEPAGEPEDFITGWLTSEGFALGRPVDILVQPGGGIYISDDHAGVIYRMHYQGPFDTAAGIPNLIRVFEPKPGVSSTSPLVITGEARGSWFFEATFPVRLEDETGRMIAQGYAQAEGEWTTEAFVPFRAVLNFERQKVKTGFIVLEKNNPSGLSEHARALRIPVTLR